MFDIIRSTRQSLKRFMQWLRSLTLTERMLMIIALLLLLNFYQQSELNTTITELHSHVDSIDSNASDIQQHLDSIDSDVSDMKSDVENIESNMP